MMAITLLLIGYRGSEYAVMELLGEEDGRNYKLIVSALVSLTGELLFAFAAILTVITGYIYLKVGLKNM